MIRMTCALAAATLVLLGQAVAETGTPGYSGMVKVSDNAFFTVNDRKNPSEPGYRLGIVSLTPNSGIVFTPINVPDWNDEDGEPRDLEACCAVPGRANEFLLAESSVFDGNFGRTFHVTLSRDDRRVWRVVVNWVSRTYDRDLDRRRRTYSGDQIEGMACFNALGKTILVYGERGGSTRGGTKLGTIVWGAMDLGSGKFSKIGEAPLARRSLLGDRDCSALRLVRQEDDAVSVLSVATRDMGDNGPFRSLLYCAGQLAVDSDKRSIRFVRNDEPQVLSSLSGIKVEALSGPAKNAPKSKFSIATDDENFGGIWRPLFSK